MSKTSKSAFEEELAATRLSIVSRSTLDDGSTVVIKALRADCVDPTHVESFRRELEIARRLVSVAGVVRIHRLSEERGAPALVMEDGGVSLHKLTRTARLDLERVLAIGARVADILGHVHNASVIHNDLNPSNILMMPATGEITLIDFGLSFVADRRNPQLGTGEGTLPYNSPEQTGRIGRPIDHRSDLYAFGATLYELLTGSWPFVFDDPAEMIHAHLAKRPVDPHLVDPAIPEVVSWIVMKLLAKDPDDRYQSAFGAAADLEACLEMLRAGAVTSFEIGRHDLRQELILPTILYGREEQRAALMEGLAAVAAGQKRMQLVGGAAGIGKTCLVEELRRPAIERGGSFVFGKFDQLQSGVPFSAVSVAFRQAVSLLLSEPPEEVTRWRAEIEEALGSDAGLVVELVPELGLLLEIPPAIGDDSGRDLSYLLPRLLIKLTARLASPAHPLVMFIDDLQWADPTSLRLFESLMRANEVRSLYLLASYRDNEVTAAHPLMLAAHALRQEGVPVDTLVLEPLSLGSVARLLRAGLGREDDEVTTLAEVVIEKTRGNPFFVRTFVDMLAERGLVHLDVRARRWTWDISAVRDARMTDNVVDLLVDKMDRLSSDAAELLRVAACLGNEFDIETLAIASALPGPALEGALSQVVDAGLLLKSDDLTLKTGGHRFAHDRVQHVAYALISESDRVARHQTIGRRLLAALPAARREERLFELLHHLNHGMDRAPRPEPVDGLAEMNLAAGRRAMARAGHIAAFRHAELGIALLFERAGSEGSAWSAHHALALELHDIATEAAFFTGDLTRMDLRAAAIRAHASPLESVRSIRVRITALGVKHRLEESIDLCIETLGELGVHVPRRPGKAAVACALGWTMLRMRGRSAESIAALPRMTDPRWLAVSQLMSDMTLIAFLFSQELFAFFHLKVVGISLSHGNSEASLASYGCFAVLVGNIAGDVAWGNRIADAVDLLLPKVGLSARVRPRYVLHLGVRHWRRPLRESQSALMLGFREATEAGLPELAWMCAHFNCKIRYFCSEDLETLERELAHHEAAIRQSVETTTLSHIQRFRQFLSNLTSKVGAEEPWQLVGEFYDEHEALSRARAANDNTHIALFYIEKLMLASLFRASACGLECIRAVEERINFVAGLIWLPQYHFHGALVQLAACDGADRGTRRKLLAGARRNLKFLRRHAKGAPMNYRHHARLVEAELDRVEGRAADALAAYEHAATLARENGFRQDEALAYELMGRFHARHGRTIAAQAYLSAARNLYTVWGAAAKVWHLDQEFPLVGKSSRTETYRSHDATRRHSQSVSLSTSMDADLNQVLDLSSVMKASQRLSSEVVLTKLVAQLMTLVAESAGAERAFLVALKDGRWIVEAAHFASADPDAGAFPLPLESCADLAASTIHYVARTRTVVVLADAAREGPFMRDPYVLRRQARSVLVVPMLRQGELAGVLYVENNQSAGAFTSERVELLGLLSSQAAISIENARLYENLERKVAERTERLAARTEEAMQRAADIRRILDNVDEGFVRVAPDGRMTKERSAILERWFGPAAQDAPFVDYIRRVAPEQAEWFEMAWEQIAGGFLPVEVTLAQLPSRITAAGRTFALRYRPLLEGEELKEVIIVVSDVTAEVERERAEAELRDMLGALKSITEDRDGFIAFAREAAALTSEITSREITRPVLLRQLHTLKGNAALFELHSLSRLCHEIETRLEDGSEGLAPAERARLVEAWSRVSSLAGPEIGEGHQTAFEVEAEELDDALALLDSGAPRAEIASRLEGLRLEPSRKRLTRLATRARATAIRLEKGDVQVVVEHCGVRLPRADWSALWSNAVHMVRNALDHGIEPAQERIRLGKSPTGTLRLRTAEEGGDFLFEIIDDGAGIDWAKLAERAAARGMPHETKEDLVEVLFADGISSRDQASEYSGRGVGMSAVRQAVRDLGGRIEVETARGVGTRMTIRIPQPRAATAHNTPAGGGPPEPGRLLERLELAAVDSGAHPA